MTADPKPILTGGSHTLRRAANLGDLLMRWPLSGAKRRRKYIYDHDAIGKEAEAYPSDNPFGVAGRRGSGPTKYSERAMVSEHRATRCWGTFGDQLRTKIILFYPPSWAPPPQLLIYLISDHFAKW